MRAEPTPASPSSSSAASSATAQAYGRLIEEALQAYEAGRYAEARNTFQRAHTLNPTARTLRSIGMCAFNLGDYTDAVYELEQALSERRMPLTEEQAAHASDLIARASAHIGRFRLRLSPAAAELLVDGAAPLIIDGAELLLEAGRHEIEARAPGYLMAHSSVKVEGGDRTTLVFHLLRDDYAVATRSGPQSVAASAVAPTRDPTGEGAWLRTLGYTSLGLGAASLLTFAVTGGLALADENKLQDRCPNGMCSETYRSTVQRYDTMRTLATASLIAGGALCALGTSLLIAQPSAAGQDHARRPRVEPLLGLGALGVRGNL